MIGSILIRYRYVILVFIIGATVFSISKLPDLRTNFDFSKDYPKDDKDYAYYKKHSEILGSHDQVILVGIKNNSSIFDTSFLSKVHSFTESCNRIPFLKEVHSITNLEDIFNTPFGLIGFPYLPFDSPNSFNRDSAIIVKDSQIINRFVSEDLRSIIVYLEFEQQKDKTWKTEILEQINELLANHTFYETHLLGSIVFEEAINHSSEQELARNLGIGLILLVIILLLLYQSFWGVFFPSLIYITSIINYLGYLVIFDHPLTIYSSFFPLILLIVTLSDVIHLVNRYEENIRAGIEKIESLKQAIHQSGLAVFLTSLLMAIGFWTFISFPIENIRQFGIDIGIGIIMCYLLTIGLLPNFLVSIDEKAFQTNSDLRKRWRTSASKIHKLIMHDGKWITLGSSFAAVFGLVSIFQIDTGRTYKNNWPSDHPFEKSIQFFESNAFGMRPLELGITTKNNYVLSDLPVLRQIETVQNHLDSLEYVHNSYSPVNQYKYFHKVMDPKHEAFALPENQQDLDHEADYITEQLDFSSRKLMNDAKNYGRISARTIDMDSERHRQKNKELDEWIINNTDSSIVEIKITGNAFMADLANYYAVKYIYTGLCISIFIIGFILWVVFNKIRVVLLVILINILPIFVTLSLMFILDIHAELTRSIVFNMVFILALDDTIHYLIHFRALQSKGIDKNAAILSMLQETGKAMTVTTILLVSSFGCLLFSDMSIARDIGILVCITSLASLVVDLLLAPYLMNRFPIFS